MKFGLSRRSLLTAFPLALAAQTKQPVNRGEFTRVTDAATENVIVRLTALTSNSVLPFAKHRFVARERTLLFASDRSGHFAPYQVDLKSGVLKQLADPKKLAPRSLCLDKAEKSLYYLDTTSLFQVGLNRGTPKLIADGVSTFSVAADGSLYLVSGGRLTHEGRTLADNVVDCWPQPNAAGCLFSRPQELLYVTPTAKPVAIAGGEVREPWWDADGESILFLRDVMAPSGVFLAEIHSKSVHGGPENWVSDTSQFATFAPNSDATVFVGASRSKAQPNVVLMLRSPHREMTLSEHHSTHPGEVSPVFSPDNRRVYFMSDHESRSAIYSVNVELLVEPPTS